MGMKHRSLIEKINPTFIVLNTTPMHHYLSSWKTGECRVPPEFGPGGGALSKCDLGNIKHAVRYVFTDRVSRLNMDFHSSWAEIQEKRIDNIHLMI